MGPQYSSRDTADTAALPCQGHGLNQLVRLWKVWSQGPGAAAVLNRELSVTSLFFPFVYGPAHTGGRSEIIPGGTRGPLGCWAASSPACYAIPVPSSVTSINQTALK